MFQFVMLRVFHSAVHNIIQFIYFSQMCLYQAKMRRHWEHPTALRDRLLCLFPPPPLGEATPHTYSSGIEEDKESKYVTDKHVADERSGSRKYRFTHCFPCDVYLLTLGACTQGLWYSVSLCVCVCYQSTSLLKRLCSKMNKPAGFTLDFQLTDFSRKLSVKSYSLFAIFWTLSQPFCTPCTANCIWKSLYTNPWRNFWLYKAHSVTVAEELIFELCALVFQLV